MNKDRYINQTKQKFWPAASLWFDMTGQGKKQSAWNISYSKASAWAHIHSWNPRCAKHFPCWECELGDVEINIIKLCDCDLTMMRLASALSGIHLDLSELTIKPA